MTDLPRIGLGIDMHRLQPGRPCILGGVKFESEVGPMAHSDGDAVLHAACDAVLGAAGLDDIGTLFEDTDPAHANRDSAEFCKETMALVQKRQLRVWSLDVVLETERPKLKPMRQAMRERIAELFAVDADRVNIKGKTLEGLGALAKGAGIAVGVSCLIERS